MSGADADDPRQLPRTELERRYADLHRRVFACYEEADRDVERGRLGREAATARAQARAEPLIEQARTLHAERVRRLRTRARLWWKLTGVVIFAGGTALLWLLTRT